MVVTWSSRMSSGSQRGPCSGLVSVMRMRATPVSYAKSWSVSGTPHGPPCSSAVSALEERDTDWGPTR